MNLFRSSLWAMCCCLVFGTAVFAQQAAPNAPAPIKITSAMFGDLKARQIGPAAMSGRITAIDVIDKKLDDKNPKSPDQRIIWVGTATGGVWKSLDNGTTFKPVFDKHTQSIGAVAIDHSSKGEVVWVGAGETNVRNSVSVGDGIYKTTDGGDNWTRMGLEKVERIAKVVIHSTNANIIYVAGLGALWSDSEDRGLYKTTDGGKTWEKILYVDAKTGCADVVMDPSNPNVLFASMWQFRRKGWEFASGGEGSGFYKSTDGGKTWKKLGEAQGLPGGVIGRTCIAFAPSNPNVVYAMVESKKSAIYRSDDKGETWKMQADKVSITLRPFYFAVLAVDPTDENRVYRPNYQLNVSTDGGKTFETIGGDTHADHHALWIDPKNPMHLLLGTDGGVYRSLDRGRKWQFMRNLPVSQFYHVSYDMENPYNVMGGLQDNGSWMAPSRTTGAMGNDIWRSVGFGDGFYVLRDKLDKNFLYFEMQGGNMVRHHLPTGEIKIIKPLEKAGEPKYRWNWNTPIAQSPKNPKTLYAASQFLFRSSDRGESWEKISPDLTTNDPAKQKQEESGGVTMDKSSAENHCTIYAVAESPLDEKVIWAGTDDGNVQVTQNGGKTWTNVVANVSGIPKNAWVSTVEPSRYDKGTAYVTFDCHTIGDWKTYVYKTTDFGKTWTAFTSSEFKGYAHVIREDLVNKNMLFVGTEFGLFVTLDGGQNWAQMKANIPDVGVRDIAIHPREHDLILATHGRGIIIFDDLTTLRAITAETLNSELAILPARPTVQTYGIGFQDFPGSDEFIGDNVPGNAVITYFLKDRMSSGSLTIDILNDKNEVLTSLQGGKRKGFNRVQWGMSTRPPKAAKAESFETENGLSGLGQGLNAPEGKYTVRITKGDKSFTGALTLVSDPRSPYAPTERLAQYKVAKQLYEMQERLAYIIETTVRTRDTLKARMDAASDAAVKSSYEANYKQFADFYKTLVAGEGFYVGVKENKLREKLLEIYGAVSFHGGAPSKVHLEHLAMLDADLKQAIATWEKLTGKDMASLNETLKTKSIPVVPMISRDEFMALPRQE
ncbi:MAG: glycosyl hydrolase [Candidatus Kapabacteria bacterium]|nr:glycosyl hydrolase [Candidatus Kapabacteria bacterium]